jgi:hypothetical protein
VKPQKCPLCASSANDAVELRSADGRKFYKCAVCWLIYCDPEYHPGLMVEKERYLTHINTMDNEGYVQFLNRALLPALKFLPDGSTGLDYGCGPGPVLAELIRQMGFQCDFYDPIFFPDLPEKTYDFVFSTEVVEHFHHPKKSFLELVGLVKPGGFLTLLTECWTDLNRFRNWYYVRDDTHVSLYHEKTMQYVAVRFCLEIIERPEARVTIFRKNE